MENSKPGPLTDPETERAWAILCELRQAEEHFNTIKAQCRTLASTWLLAAFGAMGFLLTQQLAIGLPTEVIVLGVALAASLGLTLLWILDLLVYHRLLDASFLEALKIEARYPSLPQVHHNMRASQAKGQTPNLLAWFYVSAIAAPLLFAGTLFVHWCVQYSGPIAWLATSGLGLFLGIIVRLVHRKSPNPALQRDMVDVGMDQSRGI